MCRVKGTDMSNESLNRRFHIILRKIATSMPAAAVQQLLGTFAGALRERVGSVLQECVNNEPPSEPAAGAGAAAGSSAS